MSGGHLRRRGGVFWFRRRVPDRLAERIGKREIHRSLRTSLPRVAAARSRQAWLATEAVFEAMTRNTSLTARQAQLLIDQLLAEPLHASPTADELVAALGRGEGALARQLFNQTGAELVMALPSEEQRQHVTGHMLRIADRAELNVARKRATLNLELADRAASWASEAGDRAADAEGRAAEAERQLLETEIARRVAERLQQMVVARPDAVPASEEHPRLDAAAESVPACKVKGGRKPKFSEVEAPFLHEKAAVYSGQTTAQVRATFRLWIELVGDRPVDTYTGADAGHFRDQVLRLPASHGKGGRVLARKAIEAADRKAAETGAPVPRVSMKTAKRHFSALSQMWEWLRPREHVEKNVFRGFAFPGTKAGRTARDDWAVEDLLKLFGSGWFQAPVPRDSAQRWLPIVAMFSGLRLEEAARLRPGHDVVDVEGVTSFLIQAHPEGWTPKSEAGERYVPVHPVLAELGLLDLVQRRRAEGAARLFPELRPTGPDAKYGTEFSRRFGKHKDALGVSQATTFHSFRHSVSTILRNTRTPEAWVDAVLGHEGETKSMGASVYLKRVGIQNLKAAVDALAYPVEVVAAVRKACSNKSGED